MPRCVTPRIGLYCFRDAARASCERFRLFELLSNLSTNNLNRQIILNILRFFAESLVTMEYFLFASPLK